MFKLIKNILITIGCYFKGEHIWRTNDGRYIPISKLEDKHLDSIIYMLMRWDCKYGLKNPEILDIMYAEQDRRYQNEME